MELFVGNIPRNASVVDLKRFFKGFDKKATFEVKRLRGKRGNVVFGLVTIESERLARKAIRKLHLKKLNGSPVVVREFIHRASGNDRRQLNWRKKLWLGGERRKTDRRDVYTDMKDDFDSYAA